VKVSEVGVVAVEGVDLGDIAVEISEEPEVAPVGPKPALGGAGERVRRTINRRPW